MGESGEKEELQMYRDGGEVERDGETFNTFTDLARFNHNLNRERFRRRASSAFGVNDLPIEGSRKEEAVRDSSTGENAEKRLGRETKSRKMEA